VLVRGSRIGELSRDELAGFVEGAWLSRAGPRAVAKWMKEHGGDRHAGKLTGVYRPGLNRVMPDALSSVRRKRWTWCSEG
jgi:hypothetical protein